MIKKLILLLLLIISHVTFSQVNDFISQNEYTLRKLNGTLTGNEIILGNGMINPNDLTGGVTYVQEFNKPKSQSCGGYFPPPGPVTPIDFPDDGSSALINLPFNFCFFGDTYTTVYGNGNGNISFGTANGTYSSTAFPSVGPKIIAAFWADFDQTNCGAMHAYITPTAAVFNWVDYGYFSGHCDKKNTCQIVISNGSDPIIVGGNVAINYANMSWTTGDASNGTNGFGGIPATVGANRGDGISFFQLGQFDHAGVNYDGPNGTVDGVDYLDNKSFVFDFCTTDGNIAPIPTELSVCDTIKICTKNVRDIKFPFIAPENNQTTTVSFSAPTLNNVQVISNTVAYEGENTLRINGSDQTVGLHQIVLTGTDNATIPKSTSVTYVIEVIDIDSIFPIKPIITYPITCLPLTLSVTNTTYQAYQWSTGSTTNSAQCSTPNDTTQIAVFNDGCYYVVDTINLKYIPNLAIDLINDTICKGFNTEIIPIVNFPQNVDTYSWNTGSSSPSIFITDAGQFKCTVTNICGSVTDSSIIVAKTCDIEMPNTFTPNGDGDNDVFKLLTKDLDFFKTFSITIVNRWGTIISEFNIPDFKWDGKDKNGILVENGVYFYTIKSTTIENTEINRQGFVQVFTNK